MSDLVAVHGRALIKMDHVDVIVVSAAGALAARVELGRLQSGRRIHAAVVCGGCGRAVRLLIVRDRALRCRRCLKVRTKRQSGRTTADWCRRGDREADRFLRLVASPTLRLTDRRFAEAHQLARQIIDTDRARLELLRAELADLAAYAEHAHE